MSDECCIWHLSVCRTSLIPTLGICLRITVGAVARLGSGQLRNPDSISDKYVVLCLFFKASKPGIVVTQLPTEWVLGYFPPGVQLTNLCHSDAEVNNNKCIPTLPTSADIRF